MNNNLFNQDYKKCACVGTGYFDQSFTDQCDWVECPYHCDSSKPNPKLDFEKYLEYHYLNDK